MIPTDLADALGLTHDTPWDDAIAEARRLRARVTRQDQASRDWEAAHPERTRKTNAAAAKRYRDRRKGAR